MTIELNYLERLNLRAVLGQWRGWTHSELRRVWSLMDRLELDEAEKLAINHRVVMRDGDEREFWNTNAPNPPAPREFELHERDLARVRKALQGFPWAGNDRKWAQRLIEMLLPDDGE